MIIKAKIIYIKMMINIFKLTGMFKKWINNKKVY